MPRGSSPKVDGAVPSLEEIARKIGWPAEEWAGHCHEVACMIVRAGLVAGQPRYGLYLGPVARGTLYDRGWPFVRHGWIERPDGTIVDPTRWVFEGAAPYVWVGPNDGSYNPGGNALRRAFRDAPPAFDPDAAPVDLALPPDVAAFVGTLLGEPPAITVDHVFWLANLPRDELGCFARPLFEALVRAGHGAAIPVDNRRLVLGR